MARFPRIIAAALLATAVSRAARSLRTRNGEVSDWFWKKTASQPPPQEAPADNKQSSQQLLQPGSPQGGPPQAAQAPQQAPPVQQGADSLQPFRAAFRGIDPSSWASYRTEELGRSLFSEAGGAFCDRSTGDCSLVWTPLSPERERQWLQARSAGAAAVCKEVPCPAHSETLHLEERFFYAAHSRAVGAAHRMQQEAARAAGGAAQGNNDKNNNNGKDAKVALADAQSNHNEQASKVAPPTVAQLPLALSTTARVFLWVQEQAARTAAGGTFSKGEQDTRDKSLRLQGVNILQYEAARSDHFTAVYKVETSLAGGADMFIVASRGQCAHDPDNTDMFAFRYTIRKHPRYAATLSRVDELRKAFPKAQIALAGHSLGGAVAVRIARLYSLPAVVFNPLATVGTLVRVALGIASRGIFARPLLGAGGVVSKAINRVAGGTWLALAGSSSSKWGASFIEAKDYYSQCPATSAERPGLIEVHSIAGDFVSAPYQHADARHFSVSIYPALVRRYFDVASHLGFPSGGNGPHWLQSFAALGVVRDADSAPAAPFTLRSLTTPNAKIADAIAILGEYEDIHKLRLPQGDILKLRLDADVTCAEADKSKQMIASTCELVQQETEAFAAEKARGTAGKIAGHLW